MFAWDDGLEVHDDDRQTKRQQERGREGGRAWVAGQKRFIMNNAAGGLVGKRRGSGAVIGPPADSLGETGWLRKSRFAYWRGSFFLPRL